MQPKKNLVLMPLLLPKQALRNLSYKWAASKNALAIKFLNSVAFLKLESIVMIYSQDIYR